MTADERIAELERELAEARESNTKLLLVAQEWKRDWLKSPVFETFAKLKHGIVGDVLCALQEGEISRGKAAECLAEIAHGATEVRLPRYRGYFAEDETPVEKCERLEAINAQLVEALGSWQAAFTRLLEIALQEGEISRGKAAECLAKIAHGATEVRLPRYRGYFAEDETPVEKCERLEAINAQLVEALGSWQAAFTRLLEISRLPADSICVEYDPAGSEYEIKPSVTTLHIFQPILPDIGYEDFAIVPGAGLYCRDYCYLTPAARERLEQARAALAAAADLTK